MNSLMQKSLMAVILGLGCTVFAGSAFAQKCGGKGEPACECDPKKQVCEEPPKEDDPAACSPGYYKNHVESWCSAGLTCPETLGSDPGVSCAPLIEAMNSTGRNSGTLKTNAAAFINSFCYGTADASPCSED